MDKNKQIQRNLKYNVLVKLFSHTELIVVYDTTKDRFQFGVRGNMFYECPGSDKLNEIIGQVINRRSKML